MFWPDCFCVSQFCRRLPKPAVRRNKNIRYSSIFLFRQGGRRMRPQRADPPPGRPVTRRAILYPQRLNPVHPSHAPHALVPRLGPKLLHAKVTAPQPIQGAASLFHPPRPNIITLPTSSTCGRPAVGPHRACRGGLSVTKPHTFPYTRHTKCDVSTNSLFRAEERKPERPGASANGGPHSDKQYIPW